jgi:hypothetical protein
MLHVNTTDSLWAFELAQRAVEIAARIGVGGVRFTPGPLAEPASRPPAERRPVPSPEQRQTAAELAAGIGDPTLRESVERAVGLSLARGRVGRPV